MQDWPKITVVTPSFNQGRFLEDTILSVLGQQYPNLEYIIIDGGSTDNSVDIIKKYEKHLSYWISEKDNGQAHAINKGFELAHGEILCWLNSDDLFMPNILLFVAAQLNTGESEIMTGDCIHFFENGSYGTTAEGSHTSEYFREMDIRDGDIIIQPSTFWTRKTWERTGILNEKLNYVFDWEWFLRVITSGISPKVINKTFSLYRIHETYKTGTGGEKRHKEIISVYKQFGNEKSAFLYRHVLKDKKILKSGLINKIRQLLSMIRIRPTDAKVLKWIYRTHYKGTDINKIRNILYFTGE